MNMRDYPTLHLDTIKIKEQLAVRKDMDVNEHERLSREYPTLHLRHGNIFWLREKKHNSLSFPLRVKWSVHYGCFVLTSTSFLYFL